MRAKLQQRLINFIKFVRSGTWPGNDSSKVAITVDRRLLIIFSAIAIYGAIEVVRGFHGMSVAIMPDTSEYAKWPNAGGRVIIRYYDWWGLKRAVYVAESRFYVDAESPDKTKEKRWMIIAGSGPKIDKSGHEKFPRPLFVSGYVDYDNFQTYVAIDPEDFHWFGFDKDKK